jgi:hypothetical protein
MITLTGKLLDIVKSEKKDFKTGELSPEYSAEILHKSRGKSVVESVKMDMSVVGAWSKVVGHDISCEVSFYAMTSKEGGLIKGLALADKKSLPVSAHVPTLKAA